MAKSWQFALIGVGYLFPFSAMSQPVDYWRLLFPSADILFQISAVFMYTNLFVLIGLVFGGRGKSESASSADALTRRVYGGFIGQCLALLIVPSTYFLYLDEQWNTIVILACTAFMAVATAFLDSSVIAIAACFPTKFQEALQLGVGLSTLIGCVYRVLTKLAFPQTAAGTVTSSLVYFYTGAATIILCLLCFWAMLRTPLARECLQRRLPEHGDEETRPLLQSPFEEQSSFEDNDIDFSVEDEPVVCAQPIVSAENSGPNTAIQSSRTSVHSEAPTESSVTLKLRQQQQHPHKRPTPSSTQQIRNRWQLVKHTFSNGMCITFLFLTTLAVWPALMTVLKPHQVPVDADWWAMLMLNLFAVMDVVGRFMVPLRMGVNCRNIWIPVGLRTLLIPVLMGMVREWWLIHDAWSALVVSVLGWTNGWCGSLTILLMNEAVSLTEEKRFVGTLASFYLNIGLVMGATVGLLVEKFFL